MGKDVGNLWNDVPSLRVLWRDYQDALKDVTRRQAESTNPAAFQAEREHYEALCDKIAMTSQAIGRLTAQALQSFQVGIGADIRDSKAYILQSIKAERRRQGAAPDDAADNAMAEALHEENQKLADRIEELERQIAGLQRERVTERRAKENVAKGKSAAKRQTITPERRKKAEAKYGAFSSDGIAAHAGLDAMFGKSLSFNGGGGRGYLRREFGMCYNTRPQAECEASAALKRKRLAAHRRAGRFARKYNRKH